MSIVKEDKKVNVVGVLKLLCEVTGIDFFVELFGSLETTFFTFDFGFDTDVVFVVEDLTVVGVLKEGLGI